MCVEQKYVGAVNRISRKVPLNSIMFRKDAWPNQIAKLNVNVICPIVHISGMKIGHVMNAAKETDVITL